MLEVFKLNFLGVESIFGRNNVLYISLHQKTYLAGLSIVAMVEYWVTVRNTVITLLHSRSFPL